jgi:NAD(P)-dependent dehydrogenase (short-subunit alcohol dehydrogenase family)
MTNTESTANPNPPPGVAVTGAGGSFGRALLRRWHDRGAQLIALTSSEAPLDLVDGEGHPIPLRQVRWRVGEEQELAGLLAEVDVLVLNHGVNVHTARDRTAVERSLEVNALSSWRLLELFATVVADRRNTAGAPANIICARSRTSASTHPPDTEPTNRPSAWTSICVPVGQGADFHVSTTVAIAIGAPAQSSAAARMRSWLALPVCMATR